MRGRIEERAKDVGSCEVELTPKRVLRPALPFGNRCERQQDGAVGKIGAGDDILDAVENDGSGGGKQNFVLISEQPTCRKRGTGAALVLPACNTEAMQLPAWLRAGTQPG